MILILFVRQNLLAHPLNPLELAAAFRNIKTIYLNRMNYTWNDVSFSLMYIACQVHVLTIMYIACQVHVLTIMYIACQVHVLTLMYILHVRYMF